MISLRSALLGCVVASAVLVDVNAQGATNTGSTTVTTGSSNGGDFPNYSPQIISYTADKEDLYFTGSGASATTPLVGVAVAYPSATLSPPTVTTNPASAAAAVKFQTLTNGLFEYANTGYTAVSCCYATTGTCTPDGNAFTIAAGSSLAFDTTVPATCSYTGGYGPTTGTLYLQVVNVQVGSAPISGQIEWVVDGPALNPDLQTLGSSISIPLLSSLLVNPSFLSGSAGDDSYQTWLAVDTNTAGQADTVSGTGYVAFNPSVGTGSTAVTYNQVSPLIINSIVGCSISTGSSPSGPTYVTVNDKTSWAAPTALNQKYEYFPVCYFQAVSVSGYGTSSETILETVVVSAQLHIVILSPCDVTSGHSYEPDIVTSTLVTYYNGGKSSSSSTVDVKLGLQASTSQLTVQLADGASTASFPFYQLLEASADSSNGIDTNPIGTYLSITNGDNAAYAPYAPANPPNHPGNPSGFSSPYHTYPSASASTAYPQDQNLPFLCWDLPFVTDTDQFGNPVVSTTQLDTSVAGPLVNDKTQFTEGVHQLSCHVFDTLGNTNQEIITLTVAQYQAPPGGGGGGCHGAGHNAGSACGDPQFSGFLGQSFQVHGVSGQIYNVLSTPSFQYNALFTYLTSGSCRSGTQCFAHAGNYFGAVGMLFRTAAGVKSVQVQSGSVNVGLTVTIDGVAMTVSSSPVSIGDGATLTLATPFELEVYTPEFSLKLSNSDMFINQDVAINSPLLRRIQLFKQASKSNNVAAAAEISATLPHGLLGQTHQYKTYANRWKYIEGSLFDYSVADGLTGTEFKYNRF